MHVHSCLLDELLRTYVHKQTKGFWPQSRVITFNARLRNRLLWAAAVLEQTTCMAGYIAWDVTTAAVQARCLSSEASAVSVDGGKVPSAATVSAKRFPVQYTDSAVSRGAIIQDKWFTRFVEQIPDLVWH